MIYRLNFSGRAKANTPARPPVPRAHPETTLVFPSELEMFEVLEIPQGQDRRAPIKVLFLCDVKGKETRLTAFISC